MRRFPASCQCGSPAVHLAACGWVLVLTAVSLRADDGPSPAAEPPAFPVSGFVPKQEIGALRFLDRFPEADGRGVVVAIFDTGVDPGAAGLQQTPKGHPKIIDMIDGTGSGDVDMSTRRSPQNGKLEGLTGRALELDPAWLAGNPEFRLGVKAAYDFFPAELVQRLKRQRKRRFQQQHEAMEADLRAQLERCRAEHPQPSRAEKRELDELEAQLRRLRALWTGYEDPGPVYDCLVFRDGDHWRAVVDTDEDGDLREEKRLTNYRVEHQYATFGDDSELNFAVNIYDDGDVLSLVVDSGDHGTHVAGIVAAYFPDRPELNGIAPGAQLVSVKIGDSRLAGMETASGLVRGLAGALRAECDLINMSFGEPTRTPNRGRLPALFAEAVRDHGVIYVSSAGNAGPALSTLGAPGGTLTEAIGVGAYVSPQMMDVEYSLRQALPEMPYTWTSRGPTADGDLGVDIFAPGGAISPVPRWKQQGTMRMNGTSMASPNTCGAIALLLSGLKQAGIAYSPASIRRALQNTARRVDGADVFAQGPGLLQVDQAYDFLLAHQDAPGEQLRFEATVGNAADRGIYLREAHQVRAPSEHSVRLRPVFEERATSGERARFELRLLLQTTAPWLRAGRHAVLTHGGQTVQVEVDPTGLEPGVHFAELVGLDADRPERGPLLRLPATVIIAHPLDADHCRHESLELGEGQLERRFLAAPPGATWVDVKLRRGAGSWPQRVVLHGLQQEAGTSFRHTGWRRYLTLEPDSQQVLSFPVVGGRTLEICLGQYWSNAGDCRAELDVVFHGLVPDRRKVCLEPGEAQTAVRVSAPLRREAFAPQARLTLRRTPVAPESARLTTLATARDTLADGRKIHQLVLTYRFDQSRPGRVTLRFPATDDSLYASPLGGHLWMLFDSGKRLVATDDVWPAPTPVEAGEHLVKLQLRHTDAERLDSFRNAVLWVERSLPTPIPLRVSEATGSAAGGPRTLDREEATSIVVLAPPRSAVPKDLVAGESLQGTITFGHNDERRDGLGQRPQGFGLCWYAPPQAAVKAVADKAPPSPQRSADSLEALVARLHELDDDTHRKQRLDKVVAAADEVIARISTDELAVGLGVRANPDDPESVTTRRRLEQRRDTLADALYRKGRALGYMELPDVLARRPLGNPKAHDRAFEANFAELRRWVDTTQPKFVLLHVRRERRRGNLGLALELLEKHGDSLESRYWYFKKRRDLLGELGWQPWHQYAAGWLLRRYPPGYAPF